MSDLAVFDEHLREWSYAACAEWDYPPPDDQWSEMVHARLPVGLRTEVGRGISAGAISTVEGHRFTVAEGGTGPHSWFSRSQSRRLVPNWEYFVQAAEYARIRSLASGSDLTLGFEDQRMDISVRRGDDLLWYVEVKETFHGLYELARGLDRIGAAGLDYNVDDRGNEPLQKAKLLVELRPAYFSLVGIGGRLDFSIAVRDLHHFALLPDLVPVGT